MHRCIDCILYTICAESLLGDQICDYLSVTCGLEDRTLKLKLSSQIAGIYDIAVMCDSHAPLDVIYNYRLSICTLILARSSVAHMTDSKASNA